MKHYIIIAVLCLGFNLNAQQSENEIVKAKIIEFFNAFHEQDTLALMSMGTKNLKLQTISINENGETILKETDFNQFIHNIAGIPKDHSFEEKLLGFNIQIDGNMANAWTPYEFWYQEKFSHCGVNSFQLMKQANEWKIIYLVDTRRKEGCQKNSKN